MNFLRKLATLPFLVIICSKLNAQIQVDYMSMKGFSAIGFGTFLNFAFPVNESDYGTIEGGFDAFSKDDNYVINAPCILGYRYTLDRTGEGFYVEPNLGYAFGDSDVQVSDQNGFYSNAKIAGFSGGATFGYLFPQSGIIQFNVGLRYEHIFGPVGTNLLSLRISHAFTFGRRE